MSDLDHCVACGKRPTCARAEAAILVVAKDFRGKVTALCRACGAGEQDDQLVGGGKGNETKNGK